MASSSPYCLAHKSDADLVHELSGLARDAARLMALLLAYLAELDTRKSYLGLGLSSLFAFATTRLGFSEDEACKRTQACRAARAYPLIFELVADGRLNLTTINLLAPHLTAENHAAMLAQACGKKKTEVELLVATHFPQPDVATSLRKLPTPATVVMPITPTPPVVTAPLTSASLAVASPAATLAGRQVGGHQQPVVLTPLSAERYKLQLTLSRTGRDLLVHAQELLSHQIPNGDLAAVVERALGTLCAEIERRQLGAQRRAKAKVGTAAVMPYATSATARCQSGAATTAVESGPTEHRLSTASQSAPERITAASALGAKEANVAGATTTGANAGGASTAYSPRSRHLPNAVRREVIARDGYRCSYVGSAGPCEQTRFLQFHHIEPFAKGGAASANNVKLYCASHNQHQARLDFRDVYAPGFQVNPTR